MVKLILMTDFTEKYANSLLKGILKYEINVHSRFLGV